MEDRLASPSSWRPAVRQILCVYLKQWPIDRFKRKNRSSHDVGFASRTGSRSEPYELPLVLVKNIATRQVVMAASPGAQARGICRDMTLAHAHAICPHLIHGEYQPQEDRKGLLRLARWMMHFTPIVALDPAQNPENEETLSALFLDVTGCERLYGGLHPLMNKIHK